MPKYEPGGSEPLLTPSEASARFRVDCKTISRWAKAGKLHSIRTLGGHRRFYENEVTALLRGETWDPPPGVTLEQDAPDPLKAPIRTLWPGSAAGPAAAVRDRLQGIAGVSTVGHLTALTAADLLDLGFRPEQVDAVRLALHRKDLALYGEVADKKVA
jgi:excisionase family DNA binding protein